MPETFKAAGPSSRAKTPERLPLPRCQHAERFRALPNDGAEFNELGLLRSLRGAQFADFFADDAQLRRHLLTQRDIVRAIGFRDVPLHREQISGGDVVAHGPSPYSRARSQGLVASGPQPVSWTLAIGSFRQTSVSFSSSRVRSGPASSS